jgi:hypothetical protein
MQEGPASFFPFVSEKGANREKKLAFREKNDKFFNGIFVS